MRHAIRKHVRDFLAILALFVLGLGVAGYIVSEQRLRLPLVSDKPFELELELPDAQAVTPGQGQTVRAAGIEIGQIGQVRLDDGVAVVEVQLEPKYEGLVREDATALLRAKTGLKDMFVELDPGEGRPLHSGDRIQVRNTLPDVDPDEILSALDSDTRDYLKLLVTGAGKGLDGRGSDLRETLARLGPLHRDLARVAKAVARRRHNLRRLIHNYGSLTTELGRSDRELVRLVRSSSETLGAFASEGRSISTAVSRLPGALRTTRSTLDRVNRLGQRLGPALEALRPAFRRLDATNRSLRPLAEEGAPIVRGELRPFARTARRSLTQLGQAARGLATGAPQLSATLHELNRLLNIGAHNPGGAEGVSEGCQRLGACTPAERARDEGYLYWLAWTAQNTVSLFSTSDAQGPFRRLFLGGLNCAIFLTQAEGLPEPLKSQLIAAANALGTARVCVQTGDAP